MHIPIFKSGEVSNNYLNKLDFYSVVGMSHDVCQTNFIYYAKFDYGKWYYVDLFPVCQTSPYWVARKPKCITSFSFVLYYYIRFLICSSSSCIKNVDNNLNSSELLITGFALLLLL